jgi:hypothetical protein
MIITPGRPNAAAPLASLVCWNYSIVWGSCFSRLYCSHTSYRRSRENSIPGSSPRESIRNPVGRHPICGVNQR